MSFHHIGLWTPGNRRHEGNKTAQAFDVVRIHVDSRLKIDPLTDRCSWSGFTLEDHCKIAESSRFKLLICLGANYMGRDDRMSGGGNPSVINPTDYHRPSGSIVLGNKYIRNANRVIRWIVRNGYADQVWGYQLGNEVEHCENESIMRSYGSTFRRLYRSVRKIHGDEPYVSTGGTMMARWGDSHEGAYSPGLWIARMVREGWRPGERILCQFHDSLRYDWTVFERENKAIMGWLRDSPGCEWGVTEAFHQGASLRRVKLLKDIGGLCYSGFTSLGHGPDIDVPVERWGSFPLQDLAAHGPLGPNRSVRREQIAIAKLLGIWDRSQRVGWWPR